MKELKEKMNNEEKDLNGGKTISQFWTTTIFETIYILIIEVIFKFLNGNFAFDYSLLRILLSSTIISMIISLVTCNANQKIRKTILSIFNLFVSFYPWLQIGFNGFLGAFMSIGNAEQGTKITDYIKDFLGSYKISAYALYIPFIISIFYYAFEKKILKKSYNKKFDFKNKIDDAIIAVIFLILGATLYLTIDLNFMQNKLQATSNKELFKYPSNPALTIKNFGTLMYFGLDVKGTILGGSDDVYASITHGNKKEAKTRKFDDDIWKELIKTEKDSTMNILNNYYINRPIAEKNEYTGIFKDKNVVFIMLESISQAPFSAKYKKYFPTLYKLYSEGMTGINNYSPRNNCATGESEMTSQISLYSIETTCTVNTYQKNKYPEAFLSMMAKNGYYTSTYHDYTDHYYDRSVYEYNFGTKAYYGVEDLKVPYNPEYKEWPSDLTFMQNAIPNFINHDKFATYMITVTAHTPYKYSSEMGDLYLNMFDDLDLKIDAKRYLSKVKLADLAMEHLINELKKKGILDDTVFVIFGDHYPYGLNNELYQSIADYPILPNHETDRTPFIIYNTKMEPKKITKVTTPLDYTPTLLNLFGIEYDPRYYLGNDIFSDYKDFAIFPDNSWQTEEGYYDVSKSKFIPKDESKTLTDEEIIDINKQVNELRNMSALTIKKNYFNYLFNRFDELTDKNKSDTIASASTKNDSEE